MGRRVRYVGQKTRKPRMARANSSLYRRWKYANPRNGTQPRRVTKAYDLNNVVTTMEFERATIGDNYSFDAYGTPPFVGFHGVEVSTVEIGSGWYRVTSSFDSSSGVLFDETANFMPLNLTTDSGSVVRMNDGWNPDPPVTLYSAKFDHTLSRMLLTNGTIPAADLNAGFTFEGKFKFDGPFGTNSTAFAFMSNNLVLAAIRLLANGKYRVESDARSVTASADFAQGEVITLKLEASALVAGERTFTLYENGSPVFTGGITGGTERTVSATMSLMSRNYAPDGSSAADYASGNAYNISVTTGGKTYYWDQTTTVAETLNLTESNEGLDLLAFNFDTSPIAEEVE